MSKRSWKNKKSRSDAPPPKKLDTSDLIGNVDLTNKDVEVYLIRLPATLAQQFEDPKNGVVGRLRIPGTAASNKSPPTAPPTLPHTSPRGASPTGKASTPQLFLDRIAAGASDADKISRQYDVQFQQKDPGILVFSSNVNGEADEVRLEGTVSFRCQARPKMGDAFRRLNHMRTLQHNSKSSEIKVISERDRKEFELHALRPTALAETVKQRETRKRQMEAARWHLDVPDEKWREFTRTAIVKAFNIQAHYAADELAKDIQEPVARIRPIIAELCTYNKSGPFSGRYELKDEFKTVAQRQQKEKEIEEYRQAQQEMLRKRKEERAEREKGDPPLKKPKLG